MLEHLATLRVKALKVNQEKEELREKAKHLENAELKLKAQKYDKTIEEKNKLNQEIEEVEIIEEVKPKKVKKVIKKVAEESESEEEYKKLLLKRNLIIIKVEPQRVLAFAVALELLPGQVWAAEGLRR